ncbi:hypothetical protein R1flu_006699 [Riccia fluitans]|uniref:Uncharacterized protein n=1 Tax=Riccia fluitans TaxID=41844 RepID=A0ABD1YX33_9MARC
MAWMLRLSIFFDRQHLACHSPRAAIALSDGGGRNNGRATSSLALGKQRQGTNNNYYCMQVARTSTRGGDRGVGVRIERVRERSSKGKEGGEGKHLQKRHSDVFVATRCPVIANANFLSSAHGRKEKEGEKREKLE